MSEKKRKNSLRAEDIVCENGCLMFRDYPETSAKISQWKEKPGPINFNLPLFRGFCNILLGYYSVPDNAAGPFEDSLALNCSELARALNIRPEDEWDSVMLLMKEICSFGDIMATMADGSIKPVLLFSGYYGSSNTICFSSPYLNCVLKKLYSSQNHA